MCPSACWDVPQLPHDPEQVQMCAEDGWISWLQVRAFSEALNGPFVSKVVRAPDPQLSADSGRTYAEQSDGVYRNQIQMSARQPQWKPTKHGQNSSGSYAGIQVSQSNQSIPIPMVRQRHSPTDICRRCRMWAPLVIYLFKYILA